MNRLAALRRIRRSVLARRRLLAAVAAAAAVAAGLQAAADPPPSRTLVVTAARDLPSGTTIRPADLRVVGFAPESVPTGVVSSTSAAVGRTAAGPLRAGEPVTDVRLVSGSLLAGYPGLVAAPVRIGDAGAVALLEVGDRVDVLAADPRGESTAVVVADDAPVIATPDSRESSSAATPGALVVLAVTDKTAQTVAAAAVSRYLSIVLNH
jgi:Flp pilus assembly protein CpaB